MSNVRPGQFSSSPKVSTRRVLFLLPFPPRLDATHGGGRVIGQLLSKLADRHQIALLYLRAPGEPSIDEHLRQRCAWVEEVSRPDLSEGIPSAGLRQLRTILSVLNGKPLWALDYNVNAYRQRVRAAALGWQPEIVQVEYPIMGQYLSALNGCQAYRVLVDYDPGAKAAYDLWKSGRAPGRLMPLLDLLAWKRFERAILREVQAVVVLTERDRQVLARSAGVTPVLRIPPGGVLPDQPLNPLGSQPASLLFVGNFIHPPNVDAAMRLIQAIFPAVKKHHTELLLYIVGDRAPSQLTEQAGEGVITTGYVPEVTPFLDQAALVVAPLRLGGGMRIKILEALAAGKAVVASALAVEGLDLIDGQQVILAESDEQFTQKILQLLADPGKRLALASSARAWACEHLDWGKSVAAYEALYQRLVFGPAVWKP